MIVTSASDKARIVDAVKRLVVKHHINVAGVDYDAWIERVNSRKTELTGGSDRQFEAGMRELLTELRTSHTGFFHDVPDELLPQHSIGATVRKVSVDGAEHWMFLDVFEAGAAEQAGVRPGMVLLAIDGSPASLDELPRFRVGQNYELTVRRHDGSRDSVKVRVPVVKGSKAHPPLVPPLALSHKVIDERIGYLRVGWFTATMGLGFSKQLDAVMNDLRARGCDRLIVDLRGNIGGGLGFARLASYFCPGKVPIGQSLTPKRLRDGYDRDTLPRVPMPDTVPGLFLTLSRFAFKDKSLILLTQGLGEQPFHGRIVVLINEWTNSAAEMVASFASENKLATIVGAQTAGTVLGARNFSVGKGYWLRIPVFGWLSSSGRAVEGLGVSPDTAVDPLLDLLESGQDTQLETAAALLRAPALSLTRGSINVPRIN